MGKRRRGIGRLRPNIVLYGEENLAEETIGARVEEDLGLDLKAVLVIGTALKAPGAKRLALDLCRAPKAQGGMAVWINKKESPSGLNLPLDYYFPGDCADFVSLLAESSVKIISYIFICKLVQVRFSTGHRQSSLWGYLFYYVRLISLFPLHALYP